MALVYIAGILSGIVLVSIALAGWVMKAQREIEIRSHGTPTRKTVSSTHTGTTPVEDRSTHYPYRRRRASPSSA